MEKFSSKAAANPLPATNAAAGSMERDAPSLPAQAETHPPELAAASPLCRPITPNMRPGSPEWPTPIPDPATWGSFSMAPNGAFFVEKNSLE